MCDQVTRDRIGQIVQGKIRRNEPFSAWEITCGYRQEFPTDREPHHEIKKVVHSTFSAGSMGSDYKRTPVIFNGAEAFVYHPSTIDPETRQAIPGSTSNSAPSKPNQNSSFCGTPAPGGNAIVSSAPAYNVTKGIDPNADTLYIPRAQVRALGLDCGDPAYITVNGNTVRISATDNGSGNEVHVDLRNNIRVHESYLNQAGIPTTSMSIVYANDEIVVS